MTNITPHVHYVDGVLIPDTDTPINIYLVEETGRLTVVDTGFPGTAPKIYDYVKRQGFRRDDILRVLITHLHPDHVGSLKAIVDDTGAKVYAHEESVHYIQGELDYKGPKSPVFTEPARVDVVLHDGDLIDMLGETEVIHTPGHTPGHICFYCRSEKILFCGDLFMCFGGAVQGAPVQYSLDMPTAIKAMRRVAKLDFEMLLPFHGEPVIGDASTKVRKLVEKM